MKYEIFLLAVYEFNNFLYFRRLPYLVHAYGIGPFQLQEEMEMRCYLLKLKEDGNPLILGREIPVILATVSRFCGIYFTCFVYQDIYINWLVIALCYQFYTSYNK